MKSLIVAVMLLVSLQAEARDARVVREFRKLNPCPSTGLTTGACPGWVIDHGIPLCLGGPDELWNMFWQEKAASYKKDVVERRLCRQVAQLREEEP